jgi:hypothetical protein
MCRKTAATPLWAGDEPRGRAGLNKQIQTARKEREQLKRERLVTNKIIELAQRGVRDAATLSAMTLKEFKHY